MKDDYVGNLGDYGKYGLLRALSGVHPPGKRLSLGVIWYQTHPRGEPRGNFDYLDQRKYKDCDPTLFEGLKAIRDDSRRSLRSIEESGILGDDAKFFDERVPRDPSARESWFDRALQVVMDQDVIFLDPNEGLSKRLGRSEQHATFKEVKKITERRKIAIVYHHHNGYPLRSRSRDMAKQLQDELNLKIPPDPLLYDPATTDFYVLLPEDSAAISTQRLIYERVRQFIECRTNKWAIRGYFMSRLGDQTVREAIENGLMVLRDGLEEYFKSNSQALEEEYGDDWKIGLWNELSDVKEEHGPGFLGEDDPSFLLRALRHAVGAGILTVDLPHKSDLNRIRTLRNNWAHFDEIDRIDAWEGLNAMERVLESIDDEHRSLWMNHQRQLLKQQE